MRVSKLRNLGKYERAIDSIPGGLKTLLKMMLWSLQTEAKKAARPHGGDTGDLAGGIKSELAGGIITLHSARIFTDASGAGAADMGRKPRPGKLPPLDEIKAWAQRHGISVPPFVLAYSIAKKGTKGVRFMPKAVRATKRKTRAMLKRTEREIEKAYHSG